MSGGGTVAERLPRLIGMIHLGPLPGTPGAGSIDDVLADAVRDARTLAAAGFDAVLVENFGDAPFHADDVPKATVAAMTRATAAVADAVDVRVGVNVLRNDAIAAVAVAAASGASFVRVNVLSGSMETDQGRITGRAADVARLKASLSPDLALLADVFVKHAVPPPGLTIEAAATDLWERGGADAVIVTGRGTGVETDRSRLETVASSVPEAPLYAGSGVTVETVGAILAIAHGVIVGTGIKEGGHTTAPVDAARAKALAEAAR